MNPGNESGTKDEVLQEVRDIKKALAAAAGYDLDRMLSEARTRQAESGRTIISPPAKQGIAVPVHAAPTN